ncbi:MAG: LD-carboxypeptidase [Burkholderiales bacterium]
MTKRIYVYSPSGAVRDRAAFRRGIARLKALGHEVEIDPAALASHQRFAGDDETRVAAIARAAASGAEVALTTRGGYGLTRILQRIDLEAVARSISNGTHWVGLSDFTALQCALLAKTGAATWAGPALGEDFGAEGGADDIMEACFEDLLLERGEGAGWRCGASDLPASQTIASKSIAKNLYLAGDEGKFCTENAVLWGGNLAIVSCLVGTPYLPMPERSVLFLEDVNEHPFRIERMLTQLLHAGVLARQQALVLGQFTGGKALPHDRGFNLKTVVAWLRSQLAIPIVTGLPFGHVPTKVLLPVGAQVTLAVENRDALIYWGHPS